MLSLIVNRDESFWPPAEEMIRPHPVYATLALHLLIAALYNYDSVMSGRSEEFVDYPTVLKRGAAERYRAEIEKRG